MSEDREPAGAWPPAEATATRTAGVVHRFAERRRGGVLCPLASLPRGQSPQVFLDWLAAAGARVWQILPFDPPDANGSPYSSISLNAADPSLLPDLEGDLDAAPWEHFADAPGWLKEHALFEVARARHGASWCTWPVPLRDREPGALQALVQQHAGALDDCVRRQRGSFARLARLRREANARGILLFGDVALYPALDSVDVWSRRNLFELDARGLPLRVAGVPPDYFSATGQYWGNPVYDWAMHQRTGFAWWHARIAQQLHALDVLRIDHFRGLQAAWCIPVALNAAERAGLQAAADAPAAVPSAALIAALSMGGDARTGAWSVVPGEAMLESLAPATRAALVAEDLGVITAEVDDLRARFGLPGMRVLQFAFSGDPANPHRPANIDHRQVVYTGTHDNDTTLGWLRSLDDATKAQVDAALAAHGLHGRAPALRAHAAVAADDAARVWGFIALACSTAADTAIVPLQDVLVLGSEARINVPGTVDARNWAWTCDAADLTATTAAALREVFAATGR